MSQRGSGVWRTGAALAALVAFAACVAAATVASAAPPGGKGGEPGRYIVVLSNQNKGLGANSADRAAATSSEQAPVVSQLQNVGATDITSTTLVNAVVATMTPDAADDVASNGAVSEVVPDVEIPTPKPLNDLPTPTVKGQPSPTPSAAPCGTQSKPELDPEALTNIDATPSDVGSIDGAGVKVAFLADGLDTSDPDFQRNSAYASAGSPTGGPVITDYQDFSGDGTSAPTQGGEAFLDAGSIAAQGNQIYDISQFVNPAHPLPAGCDIKIVGVAPGSSLIALLTAQNNQSSTSAILQAIQYAVAHGAQVINESFGGNPFPDTAADVISQADDAAVAAGVTVVVSTGDGGITSTIGSPASDPNVISVGATTTFRAYEQATLGGINDPKSNGQWVDDNISSVSSGGFTQDGGTLDLVAPGDENWALCSANTAMYSDCTNFNSGGSSVQVSGGTSEASPLTAGAAADVIQAYAKTHGGSTPTPALVKQILMSTATDIDAPATQQGAGLLNVAAAVKEAESMGSPTSNGGVQISPGQINVTQSPGDSSTQTVSVTNTGSNAVTVQLSTRKLGGRVGDQNGSFCLRPGTPAPHCAANTGDFPIWSGVDEIYQEEPFTVPQTSSPSRLVFTTDYQYTGQNSLLHVALLEPDGTYAGYSSPQGLADFARVEVANPPAGTWTAVFFTEKNGATAGGIGTSGPVQWDASTYSFASGDQITPSSLMIPAGATRTAQLQVTSPSSPGDTSESVVLSTGSTRTTVPVTVRTVVPLGPTGGTFSGDLSGGNGRDGTGAQTNTYDFTVPSGLNDLDVGVALANDPNDTVIASLVNPDGQTVSFSSNLSTDSQGNAIGTQNVDLYALDPAAGQWRLLLDWLNPVSGVELDEPFVGTIGFNGVHVSTSGVPNDPGTQLTQGRPYTFNVTVQNTSQAPQAFFVDPRLGTTETLQLPDQNGSDQKIALPLPAPTATTLPFPEYAVPPQTSELDPTLTGSVPVNFDVSYGPGDPDIEGVASGNTASATVVGPGELSPGTWLLVPAEVGPFGAGGAPAATASVTFNAVTNAFDPTVTSTTGDYWSSANGLTKAFAPSYVPPGQSVTIPVTITPTGTGTVSGTLYVDDFVLAGILGLTSPGGDELAAIPYSYTVKVPQSQTIAFAPLPNRTRSQSPFRVSATASSHLPVSFSTATPAVCTSGGVNGSTITLHKMGTCTVVANQSGNASFAPAPPVSRSFTVSH